MSDLSRGARFLQYRWAFEPALALVILMVWGGLVLALGSEADFIAVALCAVAVAFSRLSPVAAMGVGAVGLLASLSYVVTAPPALWVILACGAIVVWGTSLYGGVAVQFTGLVAGLLLSYFFGTVIVAPALSIAGGTADQLVAFLLGVWPRVLAAFLVATVVMGGWVTGFVLRGRAEGRRGTPAVNGAEGWLLAARPDIYADSVIAVAWPGLRLTTRRQLAADVSIATSFLLLGLVLDSSGGAPAILMLVGFSAAIAVRRLSPVLALSLAWLFALTQMLAGLPVLFGNVAILAVLYATAAYAERFVRWAGLASVGVGALLAAGYLGVNQRGASSIAEAVGQGDIGGLVWFTVATFVACLAVLGLSWTLGLLTRTWQTARAGRLSQNRAVEEQRAAQRNVVVEQERNRIARDMHDVVAHSLAVVIAQADGARYARAQNPEAVDTALTTISATAREALGDVRILLTRLRQDDAAGPQPVLADLDRLVDQMRSTGLDIEWTTTGSPTTLGSGAQLAVYRIVQEALTNALRHGDAGRTVYLSLAWTDGWVTVTIDNAVRIVPVAEPAAEIGHGLPGMRERALLAGGSLGAEAVGGRFIVAARLPAIATSALVRPTLGAPTGTAPTGTAATGSAATSTAVTA
jgi:signal transduction histidine kinase